MTGPTSGKPNLTTEDIAAFIMSPEQKEQPFPEEFLDINVCVIYTQVNGGTVRYTPISNITRDNRIWTLLKAAAPETQLSDVLEYDTEEFRVIEIYSSEDSAKAIQLALGIDVTRASYETFTLAKVIETALQNDWGITIYGRNRVTRIGPDNVERYRAQVEDYLGYQILPVEMRDSPPLDDELIKEIVSFINEFPWIVEASVERREIEGAVKNTLVILYNELEELGAIQELASDLLSQVMTRFNLHEGMGILAGPYEGLERWN